MCRKGVTKLDQIGINFCAPTVPLLIILHYCQPNPQSRLHRPSDEQGGFSWDIEFLSDDYSGKVEPIVVFGDGLFTTNPVGGVDGSYISVSFSISFRE